MTQSPTTHFQCPVLVLKVTESKILGDDLAEVLREQFLAVAVQSQAQNVILDFQTVKYLSSAGFRPLLSLHRLLRQQGGRLIFANLTPEVREIFEITRLISTRGAGPAPFEVFATVPEAVAGVYQENKE